MIAVAVADERLLGGPRREPRPAGKTRRPAHDPSGRRRSRKTGGRLDAHLLHHRNHPLHRDRRADRAHGTGLPPGGGRKRLHQIHPRKRHYPHHAHRGSRRARPHGGYLSLAPREPRQTVARRSFTGATTWRHDNNRDAMGLTLAAHAQRAQHLRRHGRRRCCTTCTNPCPIFTTTPSATALQRLDRSDTGRRMADDGLEQRLRDDQVRHARRVHARYFRHLVAQST